VQTTIARILISFSIIASTFIIPAVAHAQISGVNGHIFYINQTTNSLIDGTNGNTTVTSFDTFTPASMSISTDGTKLVYDTTVGGIGVMYVNGTSKQAVSTVAGDHNPTWSNDASKIYFNNTGSGGGIMSMNLDGTARSVLLASSGTITYANPSISPSGSVIAFDAHTIGDGTFAGGSTDIVTMPIAGGTITNLTNNAAGNYASQPDWAPDGQNLVFLRVDATTTDLDSVPASGGAVAVIGNAYPSAGTEYINPHYSPAGDSIVFKAFTINNPTQTSINKITFPQLFAQVSASGQTDNMSAPIWSIPTPTIPTTPIIAGQSTPTPSPSPSVTTTTIASSDSQPNKTETVAADTKLVVDGVRGAITVQTGGTLGGHGTVGAINVATGGHLAPGNSPGCLASGNVTLVSGASYDVDIAGATVCTEYDQQVVTGTVDLGNATLNVNLTYVPTAGAKFKIIDNDASDQVTGTFAGLTSGATVTANGYDFTISYTGGDGNDVELTAVGPSAAATLPVAALAHATLPIALGLLALLSVIGIEITRRKRSI
jgi:dipeptidyl aminopeptidase/acylaminoacyl peptidase